LARRGSALEAVEDIPGGPCDAFRLTRVAVHPESEDSARFATSGTTGTLRGIHALRTLATYRALALSFGRAALLGGAAPRRVVALAPRPDAPPSSSLGYMMALFMVDFERECTPGPHSPERWLIDEHGVNISGLERAAQSANDAGEELVILATSFALVSLLDALNGRAIAVPEGTVIMQTGGFKGKTREIAPGQLRASLARTFGITGERVVSEYGMTELTSQLYEATLSGSALQAARRGAPGVFFEPPWLRVVPVNPVSLEPVSAGQVGIARIVDLGNVDSAVAILTQDNVRRSGEGIELLGRAPGATPRGCSLAIEEFLRARSP
jgi:Acyl-protein synthetase, LuxE